MMGMMKIIAIPFYYCCLWCWLLCCYFCGLFLFCDIIFVILSWFVVNLMLFLPPYVPFSNPCSFPYPFLLILFLLPPPSRTPSFSSSSSSFSLARVLAYAHLWLGFYLLSLRFLLKPCGSHCEMAVPRAPPSVFADMNSLCSSSFFVILSLIVLLGLAFL